MPRTSKKTNSTAALGFEAKLWLTADKLRNNMDAAEYKHVVLGLIFLKYISDAAEEGTGTYVVGAVAFPRQNKHTNRWKGRELATVSN